MSSSNFQKVIPSISGISQLDFFPVANVISSNPQLLYEFSQRDVKFDIWKRDSMFLSKLLYGTDLNQQSFKIGNCSNNLYFAPTDDGFKLRQPPQLNHLTTNTQLAYARLHFCRVRGCPMCFWRRSLKWRCRAAKGIEKMLVDYKNISFLFLTLTIRNPPLDKMRDSLNQMREAFMRMSTPYKLSKNRSEGNKNWHALGFVRNSEVTYNAEANTCHPHFHIMLAMPNEYFSKKNNYYLQQSDWAAMWKHYMKCDYDPVVDIRQVKGNYKMIIPEIFKYGAKGSDLLASQDFAIAYMQQLKGYHNSQLGGIFKKYFKEESDNDDLINIDDDDKIDVIQKSQSLMQFQWNGNAYSHVGNV